MSTSNLKYLSSHQALADLSRIIGYLIHFTYMIDDYVFNPLHFYVYYVFNPILLMIGYLKSTLQTPSSKVITLGKLLLMIIIIIINIFSIVVIVFIIIIIIISIIIITTIIIIIIVTSSSSNIFIFGFITITSITLGL